MEQILAHGRVVRPALGITIAPVPYPLLQRGSGGGAAGGGPPLPWEVQDGSGKAPVGARARGSGLGSWFASWAQTTHGEKGRRAPTGLAWRPTLARLAPSRRRAASWWCT